MIILQLKSDLKFERSLKEGLSLKNSAISLRWKHPKIFIEKGLKQLLIGITEEEIFSLAKEKHKMDWYFILGKLKQRNLLSYRLQTERGTLFLLNPNGPFPEFMPFLREKASLSRFGYFRNQEGAIIVETPFSAVQITVSHPDGLALFHALAQPKNLEELTHALPQIPKPALEKALSFLDAASLLEKEEESSLYTWEFHDLLFHAKSRLGRISGKSGGTFRFLGKYPPLPALRPPEKKEYFPLFKPDMEACFIKDPPFSKVLENRRSQREQGKEPLTLNQLGEFLYRSARVQEFIHANHYETTRRPYPGGGACYELEIYSLLYRVKEISPGLYLYHPDTHSLSLRSEWKKSLQILLEKAMLFTGKTEPPQVLLAIAARFGRIAWKYEAMAYSIILKDAGALIQTFYLVATAMGLAPCAVGMGNSDLFAEAAQTDYYEETTVAEFILGSHPDIPKSTAGAAPVFK